MLEEVHVPVTVSVVYRDQARIHSNRKVRLGFLPKSVWNKQTWDPVSFPPAQPFPPCQIFVPALWWDPSWDSPPRNPRTFLGRF